MTTIAWIGSTLLAFCAVPQCVKSFRTGKADDISWMFLLMWLFGEIFLIAYILPKKDLPLIFNYLTNIVCIGIILRYKIKPRI